MRLGIFMMPVHPPARSFTDTLAEDEEKSLYADKLGFDELWLGEHFSATTEPIPSPLMFMAGLVPRTKNLSFGTAVICLPNHHPVKVAAEVAQFDHMSRGRFMFGIGVGGLFSDFELFGNADRGVRDAQGDGIDRHDPAHLGAGSALRSQGRILECPDQGRDHSRARHRLYAETVPQIRAADLDVGRQPQLADRARRRAARLGHHLRATMCRAMRSDRIGRPTPRPAPKPGKPARGENWRVARNVMVAPSDAEARDRVFSENGSNRYFYAYMREVLSRVGLLSALKPRPDMSDDEATVDAITEGSVIYGSAKTVLDKLVAFRDAVGPFGTLLMTGLDWSGPNAAWERDSMRLLAQEVMPKFRQHATAKVAV